METRFINIREKNFMVEIGGKYDSLWRMMEDGVWEPETLDIMERYLSDGGRFVDIGAWVGPTSLFAASLGSEVEAFEPHPENIKNLKRNIKVASFIKSIKVHEYGLWKTTGKQMLYATVGKTSGASIIPSRFSKFPVSIKLRNLDEITELNKDNLSLIKMDIEGAEYELLYYLLNKLNKANPPVLLSLHPHKVDRNKPLVIRQIMAFYRVGQLYRAFRKYKVYRVDKNEDRTGAKLKPWSFSDYFVSCFSSLFRKIKSFSLPNMVLITKKK